LTVPQGWAWELIVVDNGPTDGTAGVVHNFEGRLPVRLEVEPRRGQAVARNHALSAYRGSVLLWTDDDVAVDPLWMTATINAFETFQADIVFGRSVPVWTTSIPPWFGPAFAGQFALLDYGTEPFVVKDEAHQFYGLNMAFRRSAAEQLGRFREDLGYVGNHGGGGDDTEMFNRALARGLRVVYTPQSIVGHVIPADRTTKARQRHLAWSGARSNYRVVAEQFRSLPQMFGLPRFMYRLAVDDAFKYVAAVLSRKQSDAFYREIRLIRFAGLLREVCRSSQRQR
jgi:glycosyltransferase involved in cell wall biosynthesis